MPQPLKSDVYWQWYGPINISLFWVYLDPRFANLCASCLFCKTWNRCDQSKLRPHTFPARKVHQQPSTNRSKFDPAPLLFVPPAMFVWCCLIMSDALLVLKDNLTPQTMIRWTTRKIQEVTICFYFLFIHDAKFQFINQWVAKVTIHNYYLTRKI